MHSYSGAGFVLLIFETKCWENNFIHHEPRTKSNKFPTTHGGKAFDTFLIMTWLEEELADTEVGSF